MMRRGFDIALAGVALFLTTPVLLAAAAAIRWASPGPVLYRAIRAGLNGRPFVMYKLRTMHTRAGIPTPVITARHDPRIFAIGAQLRRWKVDELPQLVNVIKGDMSIVGPRPEDPAIVACHYDQRGWQTLSVRPGLTSPGSLYYFTHGERHLGSVDAEGCYIESLLPLKLALDRIYLGEASLAYDLRIMLRTIKIIVATVLGKTDFADPIELKRFNLLEGRVAMDAAPEPNIRCHQVTTPYSSVRRPLAPVWQVFSARFAAWRVPLLVLFHLVLVVISSYLAFWLRFEGMIPTQELNVFAQTLVPLTVIRGLVFAAFHLNGTMWRYAGICELRNIVGAVVASTTTFAVVLQILPVAGYPRSVLIIDSMLLLLLVGGMRLGYRVLRQTAWAPRKKRVLVFGAGDAGAMIVHDMKSSPNYAGAPVGFIDDDAKKIGERIHGVPVLGRRQDLERVMKDVQPHEILVAIPRADLPTMSGILRALEPFNLPITTLPNVRDIVNGTVAVNHIRRFSIEDLLTRPAVGHDVERVGEIITGQCVLITGAGGSIGSELCRQIAALAPRVLVLYERYENSLYTIANDLADRGVNATIVPIIGDVTDIRRLDDVLGKYRPNIVFHAAAHKHVPLMEQNPCEAVKNNVMGTRSVALAAERHGVGRFVLISTDKAVNPSSVMGATKRVAELVVQSMTGRSATRFTSVRFGNVLGSNGSVVPRFVEQIRAGGPVTVTHPEIRRYFMLIPEAVQLVMQAAAQGGTGDTFVLDMGEQVKLIDLARNLIRLSGFVPDTQIPIAIVGLRPGEKLSEELIGVDETSQPSSVDKLWRVRPQALPDTDTFARHLKQLHRLASHGDNSAVVQQLCRIVPTYHRFDIKRDCVTPVAGMPPPIIASDIHAVNVVAVQGAR